MRPRPPTPAQANILDVLMTQDYVIAGQYTNPTANIYPWGTLNALRDKGFVTITYHPDTGKRIARITSAGKAAAKGVPCLIAGCEGCRCEDHPPCWHHLNGHEDEDR